MKTVLVVMQSISHNRGCEALGRGITNIIKKMDEIPYVILSSTEEELPVNVSDLPYIDEYVKRLSYKYKWSIKSVLAAVFDKVLKKEIIAIKIRYKYLIRASKKADVIILMGADDFDHSPSFSFDRSSKINAVLQKQNNAKLIVYNCSMARGNANKSIVSGFNEADAVTARDTISFDNLKNAGVNNLYCYPDPAFTMNKEECQLPVGWVKGKMIGVNLSDLALREKYGGQKEFIMQSYCNMIDSIIDKTNYNVVLIPHVMNNADLSVLKIIYEKYSSSDRVILIDNENLTAPQLKYIISCCELYIGARTHSTIAAYSTCVPTLVVGYSIKSRGIATDLFGTDENYVVSVNKIDNTDILASAAMWLIENADSIREHLKKVMPEYSQKAYGVQELLK